MILVDKKQGGVKIQGYVDDVAKDIIVLEEALFKASKRAYAIMLALMVQRSLEEDEVLENVQDFADSIYDGKELGA